jgi:acyl dehydratase
MARTDLIGRELGTYTFPVEHGKVVEFARAVHALDAAHTDADAAAARGFGSVVAPPTFSAAAAHWTPPTAGDMGLDLRRVLAAGAEWEYSGAIVAGDVLTVTGRVADVTTKTGRRGGMTLITRENTFVNQRGELVLTVRSTVAELDRAPADHEEHA